jgi:hypothetical protein
MSNLIPTRLRLSGSTQEVANLVTTLSASANKDNKDNKDNKEDIENTPLNLNATVPMPHYPVEGERTWCENNWGPSYLDFSESNGWVTSKDGSQYLDFYSNEIPPVAWLAATVPQYPGIQLSLYSADYANATFYVVHGVEETYLSVPLLKAVKDRFENLDLSNEELVLDILASFEGDQGIFVELLVNELEGYYDSLVSFIESADEGLMIAERMQARSSAFEALENPSLWSKVKNFFTS